VQCDSCLEEIPDDSIFCPECGARQEMSRAGGLPGVGGIGLGGQDVSGGRNFGVVSGEAVINQNMPGMPPQGMPPGMMPDIMGQIAPTLPGMPPANVTPLPGQAPPNIGGSRGDLPPAAKGPSLSSGVGPNAQLGEMGNQVGGTAVSNNPSLSPTDAMVNRIAEAERAVKNERRSQWLQMNQQSAADVLSSIGGELPSHLKGQDETSAAEFLANAIGSGKDESGNDALFKRMAEVAVRRVARKRGVAVDTPQTKTESGVLIVNVTYIDDGRVLDTPEDLTSAFEHAISTEIALKGLEAVVDINLFRSKDGAIDKIGSDGEAASPVEDSDEEMFACEVCDGLVKESDKECPHCGAIFEEEEDEAPARGPPGRGGPPGPKQGGPPGPKRGGPPGPSRGGGPPKKGSPSGGPPGPKRGGPPSGGPGGGPPKRGGPPSGGPGSGGPPKRGGPPSGGPGGGPPKRGGPPGPKRGGPPGPKRGPPK
jgi:RNA polymerase subunit RPABC4/transcription elongation factor Spt4